MATNKEILKEVMKDMPKEYADQLEGQSGENLMRVMEQYPNTRNSFINTLTNKVTKSLIYSKIYTNQLKELKKGTLAYGDSIEELFVQMAQVKGFTANWDTTSSGANTPEADLIRKLVPKVSAMYIQTNVDYKGKTTVMDKSLRKAFLNEGGLQNLIGQIVGSITSAMEFTEFKLTKAVTNNLISDGKKIKYNSTDTSITTSAINTGADNLPIKQTPYIVDVKTSNNLDPKKLSKELREVVGLMKFPSDKFNLAKQLTWSEPSNLILLTTPGVVADIDVNMLANAFNVSMADLVTRTVIVDEMPTGIFKAGSNALVDKVPTAITTSDSPTKDDTKIPKAILIDKDLVQIWDTYQGAGTFYNPEGQYTNHFGNREGLFATCLFANMAVFY